MKTMVMYDKIGEGYNTTRKADPYIAGRILALLAPEKDKTYLDIGCGTGNYTIKLAQSGVNFIGIDPSAVMLGEAKNKSNLVNWMYGHAENLPLPADSIDGAMAIFTVHHWANLDKGFAEVARVLKNGGQFVIFTFTPEQKKGYWFNHFFPGIMQRSLEKALTQQTVLNAGNKAGLTVIQTEKYFVRHDLEDMFGYCGKHNPEIYFDPSIRKGMYMFSALKDADEEQNGLRKLRESIDSGEFEKIKQQYENDEGDYLFMVLKKL